MNENKANGSPIRSSNDEKLGLSCCACNALHHNGIEDLIDLYHVIDYSDVSKLFRAGKANKFLFFNPVKVYKEINIYIV